VAPAYEGANLNLSIGMEFALPLLVHLTAAVASGEPVCAPPATVQTAEFNDTQGDRVCHTN
jgi:hypothetical protein